MVNKFQLTLEINQKASIIIIAPKSIIYLRQMIYSFSTKDIKWI